MMLLMKPTKDSGCRSMAELPPPRRGSAKGNSWKCFTLLTMTEKTWKQCWRAQIWEREKREYTLANLVSTP